MARTSTRPLYALALVAAPALLGVASVVDITPQTDTTAELLTLISERPGAWSTGQLLFFLSGLLWVPAGLALTRLFGRGSLGWLGAVGVLVGGVAIVPVDAAGLYLPELAASGVPLAQQVAIAEGTESSVPVLVFEVVHVVGLFVGLLVVAIALVRTRVVPLWGPVALVAALAGLLAAPHRVVEVVAMALLVVAFGALAARVVRMSDAEWQQGAPADGNREAPVAA